jgi:hypothetical protein
MSQGGSSFGARTETNNMLSSTIWAARETKSLRQRPDQHLIRGGDILGFVKLRPLGTAPRRRLRDQADSGFALRQFLLLLDLPLTHEFSGYSLVYSQLYPLEGLHLASHESLATDWVKEM